MTDETLVINFRDGDKVALDTLLARYKPLVKARARAYFVAGGDVEDLIQEGMIGLYKAVLDFDAARNRNFAAFAALCVTRQVQTAVKTAARRKHMPLNESLSLDGAEDEPVFGNRENNPEALFLGRESLRETEEFIRENLSELERDVLTLHLDGKTHAEIAAALSKNKKSVDNTLQRIRSKVRHAHFRS